MPSEWAVERAADLWHRLLGEAKISTEDCSWFEHELAVALDQARDEEREACAKVAERFGHENYPESVWPDQQDGSTDRAGAKMARRTGENIAAAIRAGEVGDG